MESCSNWNYSKSQDMIGKFIGCVNCSEEIDLIHWMYLELQ